METFEPIYPIFGGAVATGASVAAGLWFAERYQTLGGAMQRMILAASAGFLLSAVLIEIIPQVFAAWDAVPEGGHTAMTLALAGYVAMVFLGRAVASAGHAGHGAAPGDSLALNGDRFPAMLGALALHAFFDGASIASGFFLNKKLGWVLCVALLLHKVPDGMTVASVALASGRSRRMARGLVVLVGAGTLLGAVSALAVSPALPYVLPIAAGATLHVAASDLIPEVTHGEKGMRTPVAILIGVLLFCVTHVLVDMTLGGESHAH
jgi:zinc transporter ZupT